MNRNIHSSQLSLVFLLTLLLIIGVVVADDRTSEKLETNDGEIRTFFDYIFGTVNTGGQRTGKTLQTGRTFGFRKRIQFMLMPLAYKMGVMMTMLAVLTVISLKGLMIGTILLVLKLSAIFGKLYASWDHAGHSSAGWASPPQPVHVHVHNSGGTGGWSSHFQPAYGGWDAPASGPPNEHYYYKG
ncbi:uncharacterized protein LOC131673037 [Phymastichus coffea]|uniref:uncharacterized protein LOC131673037 n=1 Tax=Phymastichus coffea TaxID=108790 RepID=UPI00273C6404|nr:uncharacterized protein LOC131673037 [Phymastichus coffea]